MCFMRVNIFMFLFSVVFPALRKDLTHYRSSINTGRMSECTKSKVIKVINHSVLGTYQPDTLVNMLHTYQSIFKV